MRLDAEDGFQASSTSRSFLESPPMENGPLTGGTDAGVSSSYFPCPASGNHVFHIFLFPHPPFLIAGF